MMSKKQSNPMPENINRPKPPPGPLPSPPSSCVRICNAIGELTSDEGDAVTILSENPEGNGPDNRAIECCGDWTEWEDERFYSQHTVDCLEAAVKAKRVWREKQESIN
jgi:hypothetical protein